MRDRVNSMTSGFTILVADRNPHVRTFLGRELAAEGYRVLTAKDGRELLRMLNDNDSPDLLVLDLELPDVSGLQILMQLQDRKPLLPIVVHTFCTEDADHPVVKEAAAFVEKTGDHIDSFMAVIERVLEDYYPQQGGGGLTREVKSKQNPNP